MKRTYPFPPIVLPLAIGAVALILGLVLPWWKFGSTEIGVFENGLFPVATLVQALGLLAMLDVCADVVLGLKRPARVGSFTREQLRIVAAADALFLAVVWYFMGHVEIALGYWVSLAGSIVAMVCVLLPGRFEMMRQSLAATLAARAAKAEAARLALAAAGPAPVVVPVVVAPVVVAPAVVATPEPAAPQESKKKGGAVVVPAATDTTSAAPSTTDFAPRWFRVLEPQTLLDPNDPARQAATLMPGTWYLARRREAGWLLADGPGGTVGSIAEIYVQWAPEGQS